MAAASTAEFARVTVKPVTNRNAFAPGQEDKTLHRENAPPESPSGPGRRRPLRIVAFGDSVMIGAKESLRHASAAASR